MAYVSEDLNLVSPNVGTDKGGSVWTYSNTAGDTALTIAAANFITDALDKGMKNGDIVHAVLDTGAVTTYGVTAVGAAGCDLV